MTIFVLLNLKLRIVLPVRALRARHLALGVCDELVPQHVGDDLRRLRTVLGCLDDALSAAALSVRQPLLGLTFGLDCLLVCLVLLAHQSQPPPLPESELLPESLHELDDPLSYP